MAKLTDEVKAFIVNALACFDTPMTVVRAVDEHFGVKLDRSQVAGYAPDATHPPAKKWIELHKATRSAFLKETGEIAIASRSVRLRRLNRMADKAEQQGNIVLASAILEQAAKEVGDAFTNKLKLSGHNGGPVQYQRVNTGIDRG